MYTDEASQMETLELGFERMREAGWDTDGDLLWGYFFVDKDISKLKRFSDHLQSLEYRFVDIFQLEDEDEGPSGEYMLHVERVEMHHPSSLAERNVALSRLASHWKVADYDGWDAGPVEKPTPGR
jgi:Regulator of ribonuclease activity B